MIISCELFNYNHILHPTTDHNVEQSGYNPVDWDVHDHYFLKIERKHPFQ